jgi:hypothetical protein
MNTRPEQCIYHGTPHVDPQPKTLPHPGYATVYGVLLTQLLSPFRILSKNRQSVSNGESSLSRVRRAELNQPVLTKVGYDDALSTSLLHKATFLMAHVKQNAKEPLPE